MTAGLYVAGVGRSGTSIATRVAAFLGLRLPSPADLMPADRGNPEGYWESTSLTALNDRLLTRLGGNWWNPPGELDQQALASLADAVPAASIAFESTFGDNPGWLWKDPRLTILLPFWEQITGRNPVLIPYRQPQAVARSIAARDGMTYADGLEIWEKHTRLLLKTLAERNVLVIAYDDLLSHPRVWMETVFVFCKNAGLLAHDAELLLDNHFVTPLSSSDGPVNRGQERLAALVHNLAGTHESFPVIDLPPQT